MSEHPIYSPLKCLLDTVPLFPYLLLLLVFLLLLLVFNCFTTSFAVTMSLFLSSPENNAY